MTDASNLGALQTQVGFLERGHSDLRNEIQAIDSKMDAGFTLLSQKLDTKTTPQWQMLSLLVGVIISIGGALYWPVREAMTKHESQIEALRSVIVPRVEHEREWRDGIEREKLVDDRIKRLFEAERKLAIDHAFQRGQLNPLPPAR